MDQTGGLEVVKTVPSDVRFVPKADMVYPIRHEMRSCYAAISAQAPQRPRNYRHSELRSKAAI